MILVQNHLQQLSGNKFYMFFIASIMLLSSCGILRPTPSSRTTPETNTKTPEVVVTETKPTTTEKAKDSIAAAISSKSWAKKDKYDIAILLPFSTDEGELLKLMGDNKVTGYQPLASLEFYEGALIALDTLNRLGFKLNIHVYNNLRDSLSTALIMQKDAFKKTDLIIGPIFNDGLKAAVPIAQKNETYLLSPLSPVNTFTDSNKYFIMANPPIESQFEATIKQILKTQQDANIIVVYRTDKPNEVKIGREFSDAFNKVKGSSSSKLSEVANFTGISEHLNDKENYVFIAGNDELYINGLIRDLSKSSRSNSITLVGLQNMLSLESVSLDYFETLNLHYPSPYWIDQNAPQVKEFNEVFEARYATRPSEFAYRGYDMMMYFATMLNTYGPDLSASCGKVNPTLRYLMYPIAFKQVKLQDGTINFIENSTITILKYEDYRFVKVN